jgi:phage tail sheath gpL-like
MAITFNNIPTTIRTPGTYTEIDNSRALQGLLPVPHKALIIGQKIAAGTAEALTLQAITKDGLADGYYGPGSICARMCNAFKENNPNTELFAIGLDDEVAAVAASGALHFSVAMSGLTGMSKDETYYLLINGQKAYTTLLSGWSVLDINSAIASTVNGNSTLPVTASTNATSALTFTAVNKGEQGNYIDIRANYYTGQSMPTTFVDSVTYSTMEGGTTNPDLANVWAVIDGQQFHYMIQPYIDASNLTEIEGELEDRFDPLEDIPGQGFAAVRATQASATTLGNTRNSPHNTIMAAYDSPTAPEEWAASLGAIAGGALNQDPARPLHTLKLKDVLAPPADSLFTRSERDILLYDGIATFVTDASSNVLIERCITTYQTNALGLPDPSYLDIQTLATLNAIRFQYKTRMTNRFIVPRFKLADDTYPVQPGTFIVTPKTIKQESIALFSELYLAGYIENLEEFIENIVVERDATDANRVNVLLPPDLINQFRVLAALIQFIL